MYFLNSVDFTLWENMKKNPQPLKGKKVQETRSNIFRRLQFNSSGLLNPRLCQKNLIEVIQRTALCPPNLLPTPWLLNRVGRGGKKTLTLCKHCSATTKTPVCYQDCFSHSTVQAAFKKFNSIPSRPSKR